MKKVMKIEGMSCKHCQARVEKALSSVNGVSKAEVDLAAKTATIIVDENIQDEVLLNTVKEAGYKPINIEAKKGLFGK